MQLNACSSLVYSNRPARYGLETRYINYSQYRNIVAHLIVRWNGPHIFSWWLFQPFAGNSPLSFWSEILPTTTKHFELLNWFRPHITAVFLTAQPTARRITSVNPRRSTPTPIFVNFYLLTRRQSRTQQQRRQQDGFILRSWSLHVGTCIFRHRFFVVDKLELTSQCFFVTYRLIVIKIN